jgi:hypothetical protein
MPTTRIQYDVSDDDLDELEDGVDDDVKPDIGLLHGQLTKPRHVTLSCKQLHGELDLRARSYFFSDASGARTRACLLRGSALLPSPLPVRLSARLAEICPSSPCADQRPVGRTGSFRRRDGCGVVRCADATQR